MLRNQEIATAIILDGEALSNAINKEGFVDLVVQVPTGSHAAAVTIQILSGDNATWIDATTLADTTNIIKPLAAAELAAVGAARNIRLKLGSNVTGDKTYYVHMSS